MLASVVVLLAAQVEVKALPLEAGLAVTVEPQASNADFVWLQVPFTARLPGGGASVFRFDRRDGGVVPMARAELIDRVELVDRPRLPRTWGNDQLIRSTGVVGPRGFHPFSGQRRAIAATFRRALLVTFDGGALDLLEFGSDSTRALGVTARGVAFARPDGRFVVHGVGPSGTTGAVFIDEDGGVRFQPNLTPVLSLGGGVLLAGGAGLFTEAGERVGDFSTDPHDEPVTVVASGDELRVTDGADAGRALRTRLSEIQFDRTALGHGFVVFSTGVGPGLIVESLSGGGRVVNPTAPAGRLVVRHGRVRYESLDLEVFADGGVGAWVDERCAWTRLVDGRSCVADGGLFFEPLSRSGVQRLAENLQLPEPMSSWDTASVRARQGALLFGSGSLVHRTDGDSTLTLAAGDVLQFEAGGRLVLATDGVTLVDPRSGERTPFGFPVSTRTVPAERSWFALLTGCRLHALSADGTSRQVAQVCPSEVVDTPGGVLLLTNDEFSFWNARQGRFQPVALPEPTPTAQAPTVRAVVGDTVWVTTPSNSTVAIDAPTGLVLRTLPTTDTLVTPFGTLLDSRTEPVWESLDGGTSRFDGEPSVARRPTVKQGSGAVWLVGLQVQVTTGGPRVLLEFVSGLDWADAEAIGTTLVSVRDGGLEVLDADGGRRRYEVPVLDEPRRFGDRLWFTGWDEAHGAEPWFFDGTQPRLAADVLPGPRSSFPQFVGSFDRGVVLQAMRDDGRNGGVALLLDPPLERLPPLPLSPGSGCGCGAAEATWLPALALLLGRRRAKSLPRR